MRTRDLVSLAYVLNELAPAARESVLQRLWDATADTLVIIEPGTPAGWERILAARRQLIEAGAHVLAPCPHAFACPLQAPDWCHFAERVSRSRLHRLAKGEADIYPRVGPTCEWATAAGHAVLAAAGGTVTRLDATPLLYGNPTSGFINPDFVAWARSPMPRTREV